MLEYIQQFFFLFAQPELTLNNNHKMLEPVKNSKKPIKVSQKNLDTISKNVQQNYYQQHGHILSPFKILFLRSLKIWHTCSLKLCKYTL